MKASDGQDYLAKILDARVYDLATVTPLQRAATLSQRFGSHIYLKREDMQPIFSFKLRGAYNKMAGLSRAERDRGVICASAGNHAQGVALSAARLGCKALIVMPRTTPQIKVEAVRALGHSCVDIILHGHTYSEASDHAAALAAQGQLSVVHPFDDPDVIAGQGTIGMEILRQCPRPLHAIFVAVGGGGLIAGIGAYVKQVRPGIRIIGVQAVDSDAMKRSLDCGRRVVLRKVGLFSDGTAVRRVGRETFRIARQVVDEILLVDADAICAAIEDSFYDTRTVLEPAGALAVAGAQAYLRRARGLGLLMHEKTIVAVTGGANIDFKRLGLIVERAGMAR